MNEITHLASTNSCGGYFCKSDIITSEFPPPNIFTNKLTTIKQIPDNIIYIIPFFIL